MFKGVKRSVDFNISLDIKNKIPRLDFIEMMEDSYETSIIDFLADEFTNELLKNPETIKDMIKSRIRYYVYGEEATISVNDQITDAVTQVEPKSEPKVVKPRAPRKPRAKKEVIK